MVTHKYNSQKNRDTEKFENFDSLTLWIRNFPNGQLYPNWARNHSLGTLDSQIEFWKFTEFNLTIWNFPWAHELPHPVFPFQKFLEKILNLELQLMIHEKYLDLSRDHTPSEVWLVFEMMSANHRVWKCVGLSLSSPICWNFVSPKIETSQKELQKIKAFAKTKKKFRRFATRFWLVKSE